MSAGQIVDGLVRARRDQIVVTTMTGLGLWPQPGPRDFRLLGLMGAAASIGLGLALARPDDEVWVIDGDGSLMMQLGVLCAVAEAAPPRLAHIVIDNRVYGVSGAQPVPAHRVFDWEATALASGYRAAVTCHSQQELTDAMRVRASGPRMVVAACEPVRPDYRPGAFDFDARGEAARLRAGLFAG